MPMVNYIFLVEGCINQNYCWVAEISSNTGYFSLKTGMVGWLTVTLIRLTFSKFFVVPDFQ